MACAIKVHSVFALLLAVTLLAIRCSESTYLQPYVMLSKAAAPSHILEGTSAMLNAQFFHGDAPTNKTFILRFEPLSVLVTIDSIEYVVAAHNFTETIRVVVQSVDDLLVEDELYSALINFSLMDMDRNLLIGPMSLALLIMENDAYGEWFHTSLQWRSTSSVANPHLATVQFEFAITQKSTDQDLPISITFGDGSFNRLLSPTSTFYHPSTPLEQTRLYLFNHTYTLSSARTMYEVSLDFCCRRGALLPFGKRQVLHTSVSLHPDTPTSRSPTTPEPHEWVVDITETDAQRNGKVLYVPSSATSQAERRVWSSDDFRLCDISTPAWLTVAPYSGILAVDRDLAVEGTYILGIEFLDRDTGATSSYQARLIVTSDQTAAANATYQETLLVDTAEVYAETNTSAPPLPAPTPELTIDLDVADLTADGVDAKALYLHQTSFAGSATTLNSNQPISIEGGSGVLQAAHVQVTNAQSVAELVLPVFETRDPLSPMIVAQAYNVTPILHDQSWSRLSINASGTVESVVLSVWTNHTNASEVGLVLSHDSQTAAVQFSSSSTSCSFAGRSFFTKEFQDHPAQGMWSIGFIDSDRNFHSGSLLGWSLVITPKYLPRQEQVSNSSSKVQTELMTDTVEVLVPRLPATPTQQNEWVHLPFKVEEHGRVQDVSMQLFTSPLNNAAALNVRLLHVASNRTSTVYTNTSSPSGHWVIQPANTTLSTSSCVTCPAAELQFPTNAFQSLRLHGYWMLSIKCSANITLYGASVMISAAPNIHASFNNATATLSLIGLDSAQHYSSVLSTVVYLVDNTTVSSPSILRNVSVLIQDELPSFNATAHSLISIHHLNDVNLTSIKEDDIVSQGALNSVRDVVILANDAQVSFLPERDLNGIAITYVNNTHGMWQYTVSPNAAVDASLATFVNITDVSPQAALGLRPNSTHPIFLRFVPHQDFHEFASFRFQLWEVEPLSVFIDSIDLIDGEVSSVVKVVNVTENPFVFPQASALATISVESINDSPVVFFGAEMASFDEDTANIANRGDVLADILAGYYADVDRATPRGEDAQLGVAIVGADNSYGTWDYTCNGITFVPLIGGILADGRVYPETPTETQATLLAGMCAIRFRPQLNFNSQVTTAGTVWPSDTRPCVQLRGWDNTGATRGMNMAFSVDSTSHNHTDEFSTDIISVCVSVLSVNDAPIMALGEWDQLYLEKANAVPLVNSSAASLIDVDDANLKQLRVQFNAIDGENERISFANKTGIQLIRDAHGVLIFNSSSASPTIALHETQLLLQSLTYFNALEEPTPGIRTFNFTIMDDEGAVSEPAFTSVQVVATNDAPVLYISQQNLAYVPFYTSYLEGGNVSITTSNASIHDFDNTTMSALTVSFLTFDGENESLVPTYTPMQVTTSFHLNTTTNIATLSAIGEANVSEYIKMLRSIQYSNSLYDVDVGAPTTQPRVFYFVVSDGQKDSAAVQTYMSFTAVNDEPFLLLDAADASGNSTATFIEEGAGVSVTGSGGMVLFDVDNSTLAQVTITIMNAVDGAMEALSYVPYVESTNQGVETLVRVVDPNATYHGATQSLVLSGLQSVRDYQRILETVTYVNYADEPSTEPRLVQVTASDGQLESIARYCVVSIELKNDSPRVQVDNDVKTAVPHISEDILSVDNVGTLVSELVAGGVLEDDDSNATVGIAVVGVDQTHGQWQYQLTDGGTWQTIFQLLTSVENAVLLSADNDTRVRFKPAQHYHGNASFMFVAWDATDGRTEGMVVNATSVSDQDAFSRVPEAIVYVVDAVNDAPEAHTTTGIVQLPSIDEDDVTSDGKAMSVLEIVSNVSAYDVDLVDGGVAMDFGIGIVGVNETHGVWQVSGDGGTTYVSVGSVSESSALLLDASSIPTPLIRFVPDADYHGQASFDFVLWDKTHSLPSVLIGDTALSYANVSAADSMTGEFDRKHTITSFVLVLPVNDAPLLRRPMSMLPILEDDVNNTGTLVAALLRGSFYDVDWQLGAKVYLGLAVTEVDRRFGDWLWRCNDTDFVPFIGGILENGAVYPTGPTERKATLLGPNCTIKFVPNKNFNTEFNLSNELRNGTDQPFIKVKAWDLSGGEQNDFTSFPISGKITVNVESQDTSSEFGNNTEVVRINVTSVNDVSVLMLGGLFGDYSASFVEGSNGTHIADPILTSISDEDHVSLHWVVLQLLYTTDDWFEYLMVSGTNISSSGTPNSSVLWSTEFPQEQLVWNSMGTGVNRTYVLSGNGSLPFFSATLRSVLYRNDKPEPTNNTRVVIVTVSDGLDTIARTSTISVLLTQENAPIVSFSETSRQLSSTAVYTEGQAFPLVVGSNISVSDEDHPNFFYISSAVAYFAGGKYDEGGDELLYTTHESIYGSFNKTTGVLSLTGRASSVAYSTALRNISLRNTRDEPMGFTRFVKIEVTDSGGLTSAPIMLTVPFQLINEHPTNITLSPNNGVLVEDQDHLIHVGAYVTLADADVVDQAHQVAPMSQYYLANATVTLFGLNSISDEGLYLNASGVSSKDNNIKVFTNFTHIILQGPAPLQLFQSTLSEITYFNEAEEPTGMKRIIEFTVHDGAQVTSTNFTIQVVPINDVMVAEAAPNKALSLYRYWEGQNALTVFPAATLVDNDNVTAVSMNATISGAVDAQNETIAFGVNITKLFDGAVSVTELQHSVSSWTLLLQGQANISLYEQALQSIVYRHTDHFPGNPTAGNRTVTVVFSDGIDASNRIAARVDVVPVNDPPQVVTLQAQSSGGFKDLSHQDANQVVFVATQIETHSSVPVVRSSTFLFDSDSHQLSGLEVVITSEWQNQESLTLVGLNSTQAQAFLATHNLTMNTPLDFCILQCEMTDDDGSGSGSSFGTFASGDTSGSGSGFMPYSTVGSTMNPLISTSANCSQQCLVAEPSIDAMHETCDTFCQGMSMQIAQELQLNSTVLTNNSLTIRFPNVSTWLSEGLCEERCHSLRRGSSTISVRGLAPISVYQDILHSVRYKDYADEPSLFMRTISVRAADDMFLWSPSARFGVNVSAINDAPRFYLNATVLEESTSQEVHFVSTLDAVQIAANAMLEDDDDMQISAITFEFEPGTLLDGDFEGLFIDLQYLQEDPVALDALRHMTLTGEASNETSRASSFSPYDQLYASQVQKVPGYSATLYQNLSLSGVNMSLPTASALIKAVVYVDLVQVPKGSVSPNGVGTFAPRNVRITVFDSLGAPSNSSMVSIVVQDTNTQPLLDALVANLTTQVQEDGGFVSVNVLGYFFDDDSATNGLLPLTNWTTHTTRVESQPAFGSAAVVGGTIVYNTSDVNDYGTRVVGFAVCDEFALCSPTANVTVHVLSVNDGPLAVREPLVLLGEEDIGMVIDLDTLYYDIEDDRLEPFWNSSVDGSALGHVTMPLFQPNTKGIQTLILTSSNRSVYFIPDSNFVGNATIQFEACDSESSCASFNVTVVIQPVNDVPSVPSQATFAVGEDSQLNVTLTLEDIENSACPAQPSATKYCAPLNVSVANQPNNGTASIAFSGAGVDVTSFDLLYKPDTNFFGIDGLTLLSCDQAMECRQTLVLFDVVPVDDLPVLTLQSINVFEDTVFRTHVLPLVFDVDNALSASNISVSMNASHGLVQYLPENDTLLFVPETNYFGMDSFVLSICNSPSLCTEHSINVTVVSVNDVPVVANVSLTILEDHTTSYNLLSLVNDVANEPGAVTPATVSIYRQGLIGHAVYNSTSGNVTYVPELDAHGTDTVVFMACDEDGGCELGTIELTILPVNDDPRLATNYTEGITTFEVEEDTFNLVPVFAFHHDPDDDARALDIDLKNSLISHLSTSEGGAPELLLEEVVAPTHGALTMYSAYGIIGYKPEENFVGNDSFIYRVCDQCAPRRNRELGRLQNSTESDCVRQQNDRPQEDGCLELRVLLRVVSINDAPILQSMTAVIGVNETATLDPISVAYDEDDTQFLTISNTGSNPIDFGLLHNTSNIVASSLGVFEHPDHGIARVVSNGSQVLLQYMATDPSFSGYDSFSYQLCDASDECTESSVQIQVAKEGPLIVSVEAVPACGVELYGFVNDTTINCTGLLHTDAKYGTGDKFVIRFSEDTNMAPHGSVLAQLSQAQTDTLLKFSTQLSTVLVGGYHSFWMQPDTLVVVIDEAGEAFPIASTLNVSVIGGARRECGQFSLDSDVQEDITNSSDFCLLSKDETSFHSAAHFSGFSGHFGFSIPQTVGVDVVPPAGVQRDYFGQGTVMHLMFTPTFSNAQLALLCLQDPVFVLNTTVFGAAVSLNLECSQVAPAGSIDTATSLSLTEQEWNCTYALASLNAEQQAECSSMLARRAITTTDNTTSASASSSALSVLTLEFLRLDDPTLSLEQADFYEQVRDAVNVYAHVLLLQKQVELNAAALFAYLAKNGDALRQAVDIEGVYVLGNGVTSPKISSVTAAGSSEGLTSGDTLTITFDRATNIPSTNISTSTLSGDDLLKIFNFSPALGVDTPGALTGEWVSKESLIITIHQPNVASEALRISPSALTISMTPTSFNNPCKENPSVCGLSNDGLTIGVCDSMSVSCRASTVFSGLNITGAWDSFDTDGSRSLTKEEAMWFLALLIPTAILVVVVLYRVWWRNDTGSPGKVKRIISKWKKSSDKGEKDTLLNPTWERPPGAIQMRTTQDPFLITANAKLADSSVPHSSRFGSPTTALPKLTPLKQSGGRPLPALRGQQKQMDPFAAAAPRIQPPRSFDPFASIQPGSRVLPKGVPTPNALGPAVPRAGRSLPSVRGKPRPMMPGKSGISGLLNSPSRVPSIPKKPMPGKGTARPLPPPQRVGQAAVAAAEGAPRSKLSQQLSASGTAPSSADVSAANPVATRVVAPVLPSEIAGRKASTGSITLPQRIPGRKPSLGSIPLPSAMLGRKPSTGSLAMPAMKPPVSMQSMKKPMSRPLGGSFQASKLPGMPGSMLRGSSQSDAMGIGKSSAKQMEKPGTTGMRGPAAMARKPPTMKLKPDSKAVSDADEEGSFA
eukprot:m.92677 g.92677  ORF g.92677 m.92677 type:complete len:4978 (-) comp12989_c0_seq3:2256-17189(-)